MAEPPPLPPLIVRSWKSLSSEELGQKLTSLGLIFDRKEKVIICTKCQYALKPSDAVSKHLGDKHEINAKERHGLHASVEQLQLLDPKKLEPRPDGFAPYPCLATIRVWLAYSALTGPLAWNSRNGTLRRLMVREVVAGPGCKTIFGKIWCYRAGCKTDLAIGSSP